MSDTLRLLKHPPSVALLIMANNHHNLHLRPEYARVGAPVTVNGAVTEVVIESFDSGNDFIPNIYSNQFTFRYRRLNVADVLGNIRLNLTPPITIAGVVENIAQLSGVVIVEDDFENGLVEEETFILRAKSESLRWVGQTTVVLNQPDVIQPLAQAFPNNVLSGLTPPEFGDDTPLSSVITDLILDGLRYPDGSGSTGIPLQLAVAMKDLNGFDPYSPPVILPEAVTVTDLNGFDPS